MKADRTLDFLKVRFSWESSHAEVASHSSSLVGRSFLRIRRRLEESLFELLIAFLVSDEASFV